MQKLLRFILIILVAAGGIGSAQTGSFACRGKLNNGGVVERELSGCDRNQSGSRLLLNKEIDKKTFF